MVYSGLYKLLFILIVTKFIHSLQLARKIQGPRSYIDKIAIVGAGPSGVHMALSLKKLGFKNIEILEKTGRIGGKSHSIQYRGSAHELGTVNLGPGYERYIIPLVTKYLSEDDLSTVSISNAWGDNTTDPVPTATYWLGETMKHFRTNNVTEAGLLLMQAIQKYISIHKSLFGDYEGEIMPEPTSETWSKINGTFLDFLKRHNLEALRTVFTLMHTLQGYGYLDEVACFYGLMWNNQEMMKGLIALMARQPNAAALFYIKSGFQTLWENIVKEEKLDVKLNIDIKSVYRSKLSGYTDIWLEYSQSNGDVDLHHYDFLMWSPDMSTSMKYWKNKEISNEQLYFNYLLPRYFTTALINSIGTKRGTFPVDHFYGNINQKGNGSLWAQRDTYAAIRRYAGVNYTQNMLPNGNDKLRFRTTVTYQMSEYQTSDTELKNRLNETLKNLGAAGIEILYFKTWRYAPTFSHEDIEKGYLWRVIEMQGKYGMWYIGSSVCFESVKSVVEYNELLLRNMETPSDDGSIASKASLLSVQVPLISAFLVLMIYLIQ